MFFVFFSFGGERNPAASVTSSANKSAIHEFYIVFTNVKSVHQRGRPTRRCDETSKSKWRIVQGGHRKNGLHVRIRCAKVFVAGEHRGARYIALACRAERKNRVPLFASSHRVAPLTAAARAPCPTRRRRPPHRRPETAARGCRPGARGFAAADGPSRRDTKRPYCRASMRRAAGVCGGGRVMAVRQTKRRLREKMGVVEKRQ